MNYIYNPRRVTIIAPEAKAEVITAIAAAVGPTGSVTFTLVVEKDGKRYIATPGTCTLDDEAIWQWFKSPIAASGLYAELEARRIERGDGPLTFSEADIAEAFAEAQFIWWEKPGDPEYDAVFPANGYTIVGAYQPPA